jgi:large subunit ribosomal protein L25
MEGLELEAAERKITGKKVRFLRRQGLVPANIYGHGIDSMALQIDTKSLKHMLTHAGKTDLVSLKIGDSKKPVKVLLRKVQRNPLTDEPLHVELYQVKMTEKIKTEVPLVLIGEAPVLKHKNVALLRVLDALHIEALPDDLPHSIEVDISVLQENDQSIHVKDLKLPHGVTLHTDPEEMVVKVAEAKKEVVVEAVEAEAAPEAEIVGEEAEAEAEAEEAKEE